MMTRAVARRRFEEISDEQKRKMIELHEDGLDHHLIAERFGISPKAVHNIIMQSRRQPQKQQARTE